MSDFDTDDFFGNGGLDEEPAMEEEDEDDAVNKLFEEEKKAETAPAKPKRKIPAAAKLNEALLMGPKGIKHLLKMCEDFKFNPKLGPYQNMENLMKRYQHWAHIMYPKYRFEDTISQCERLGNKRPIKVYMERLRQGLAMTGEEFDERPENRKDMIIDDEEKDPVDRFAKKDLLTSSDQIQENREIIKDLPEAVPRILTEEERRRVAENRLRALEIREQKLREKEEAEKMEEEWRQEMDNLPRTEETTEQEEMLDEDEIMRELGY